ncbi:hypothetical protein ACFORH_00400 [Amycolatopsis roodepoortensis]|uniref:XRE family transcriptional regulator n=1 Tax=Amycolatopsis roodepoortensis TaxID=700274 RepID=A0ABR9L4J2_9PSEU|nr:hypothetical protein [Amycolatopsis roodepoortensis]MBE1575450.1 hypothetical protein [Amycolatopsis roodepoortensis]
MSVSATDVISELKLLRRGRGLSAVQLGERIGPALRTTFRISEDDDDTEVRRKVSEGLYALAASLPADLRIALLAAFALHEEARIPFYQDRVTWLARTLDRDDRTARRRIDEGIEQLAALATVSTQGSPPAGRSKLWHTEELRVALALDQPVPEAFEFRRIVADSDDISELDLALTLATRKEDSNPAQEDLKVDVFHGGRLTASVRESRERIGLGLRLPTPLDRRGKHEFALRLRGPMQYAHYVCVPRHPVDLFDLHIRFASPAPVQVVQLDKVFQEDVRDKSTSSTPLPPDDTGEVHVQFRNLAPGFAYGVRWITASTTGIQTH